MRGFFTPTLPTGKSIPKGDRTPADKQGAQLSPASQLGVPAVRKEKALLDELQALDEHLKAHVSCRHEVFK